MEPDREMSAGPARFDLLFGGVRGSWPVNGPDFERYGGATTAFALQDFGTGATLVIDAGSGLGTLSPLVARARREGRLMALFTHFHLDHLIGLPAFAGLASAEGGPVPFLAPELEDGMTLERALRRLYAPPFWPVDPLANAAFEVLPLASSAPREFGPFAVSWSPVPHPGGCVAYRVDHRPSGKSVIVATDMEWRAMAGRDLERFLAFCAAPRPPDCLVMDGQYSEKDIGAHAGWGHSAWQDCVKCAAAVKARRLLVVHHDPAANDAALNIRRSALARLAPGIPAAFARARDGFVFAKD